MDYSFIDKLLERYWQCATSLEEEEKLKAFFRQKEIPQRFENTAVCSITRILRLRNTLVPTSTKR